MKISAFFRVFSPKARLVLLGLMSFGALYFFSLYRQVTHAFEDRTTFIPTRLYSDVTRISAPMAKGYIETKLKSLGYLFSKDGSSIRFTLHSVQYPKSLLPNEHITLQLQDQAIQLEFDGSSLQSRLLSIRSPLGEHNDFFLEPEFLSALTTDQNKIRESLKLSEFPSEIAKAVIAAEDQNFRSHFGIDPKGFIRAMWVNLRSLSLSQGGSTLTQQLVKNLMERRDRNVFLKVSELFLAPVVELRYSKDEILERYLNEVYLGQIGPYEVRGFSEGAKFFFGKSVQSLNLGEIALLVGLIKGPGFYSPYKHLDRAQARSRYVLERMLETEQVSDRDYKRALAAPIRLAQAPTSGHRAPYFVDFARAELLEKLKGKFNESDISEKGLQVYTTLDLHQYQTSQNAIHQGLTQLESELKLEASDPGLQSAAISLQFSTGKIQSLIGGKSYALSNFNRVLNMKRQPGSTFKPFVYLTALLQRKDAQGRIFTPAYPILDAKFSWKYDPSQPIWNPTNYEKDFLGWIPLKTALSKSINTATARLTQEVGLENLKEVITDKLKFQSKMMAAPSLALGGFEVSPMEIAQAYSIIANKGMWIEPYTVRTVLYPTGEIVNFEPKSQRMLPVWATEMMVHLLEDVFENGTGKIARSLGFRHPAAGKTGTTNDYRDAWFSGFTTENLTTVWVGLDQGTLPKAQGKKLTGSSAALPIWVQIMKEVSRYSPEVPFDRTESWDEVRLDLNTGQKAKIDCPEEQTIYEHIPSELIPDQETCASSPSSLGEKR